MLRTLSVPSLFLASVFAANAGQPVEHVVVTGSKINYDGLTDKPQGNKVAVTVGAFSRFEDCTPEQRGMFIDGAEQALSRTDVFDKQGNPLPNNEYGQTLNSFAEAQLGKDKKMPLKTWVQNTVASYKKRDAELRKSEAANGTKFSLWQKLFCAGKKQPKSA